MLKKLTKETENNMLLLLELMGWKIKNVRNIREWNSIFYYHSKLEITDKEREIFQNRLDNMVKETDILTAIYTNFITFLEL